MAEKSNAQVALESASRVYAERASGMGTSSGVISLADRMLSWLNENTSS